MSSMDTMLAQYWAENSARSEAEAFERALNFNKESLDDPTESSIYNKEIARIVKQNLPPLNVSGLIDEYCP